MCSQATLVVVVKQREHVALAIARIGEERQHLIAMAREHDLVEPHRRPIAEGQRDRVLASPHRMNRCALVDVARQRAR